VSTSNFSTRERYAESVNVFAHVFNALMKKNIKNAHEIYGGDTLLIACPVDLHILCRTDRIRSFFCFLFFFFSPEFAFLYNTFRAKSVTHYLSA